jgi:hypothetical protein
MKEIGEIKSICQIGGKSADVFLTKCSKLCLFMCVKDPPVVLDFNFKRGDPFNKDKLSAFTKAGDSYYVFYSMTQYHFFLPCATPLLITGPFSFKYITGHTRYSTLSPALVNADNLSLLNGSPLLKLKITTYFYIDIIEIYTNS